MPSSKRFISRLWTLLFVLLLGYISAHTVNGSPGDLGNIPKYVNTLTGGTPVVRKYRLNSLCSNRDVQMGTRKKEGRRHLGGGGGGGGGNGTSDGAGRVKVRTRKETVNARGRRGSKYTVLTFQSQGRGVVQILGEHAHKYLCFNRRGRLIIRSHVTDDGRCLFTEELEDNYTMLKSKANELWYVGFNKRGRRMKGYRSQDRRKRRCYQFNKENIDHKKRHRHRVGPLSRVRNKNWFERSMRRRGRVVRDVTR